MAGKIYVGVNEIARTVKKMYIGVAGTARSVKRAYIGINGLARLFFSYSKGIYRHGAATPLSQGRSHLASSTVGNYAVFAGGYGSDSSSVVDAYNTNLTRTVPTALSVARGDIAATAIGSYVLLAGGALSLYLLSDSETVEAYSSSLTRYSATNLSKGRTNLIAATVGTHALVAGGDCRSGFSSSPGPQSTVDAYDTSLTRTTPAALSTERRYLAAASVGNYVLFGGGSKGRITQSGSGVTSENPVDTVDAYNASLTRTTPTVLSSARERLTATGNGSYAIFAGGYQSKRVVDAYDKSLTRVTPADRLSCCGFGIAATRFKNYALFGGGKTDFDYTGPNPDNNVDAYDMALTHYNPDVLQNGCGYLAAAQIGNYALFGGGEYVNYARLGSGDLVNSANGDSKAIVEVYTIA